MELQIPERYIIAAVKNEEIYRYYYIGEYCAEWSSNIRHAEQYKNMEEVEEVLRQLKSKETQINAMSGGSIYPNTDLSGALGLSDEEPSATIKLVGIKLTGAVVTFVEIEGSIKHPTGYTYD